MDIDGTWRSAEKTRHNIFHEPDVSSDIGDTEKLTQKNLEEMSSSSRKGRMKESTRMLFGKSDSWVIAEGCTRWSEAGIDASAASEEWQIGWG